jgi:hypothetical protein
MSNNEKDTQSMGMRVGRSGAFNLMHFVALLQWGGAELSGVLVLRRGHSLSTFHRLLILMVLLLLWCQCAGLILTIRRAARQVPISTEQTDPLHSMLAAMFLLSAISTGACLGVLFDVLGRSG